MAPGHSRLLVNDQFCSHVSRLVATVLGHCSEERSSWWWVGPGGGAGCRTDLADLNALWGSAGSVWLTSLTRLAWTPISGRASGMFRWENMETEWSMFFVAIAEAAAPCCGHKPHACHSSSPITLLITCGPLKFGMMSGWKRILGMTGLKWHVVHQPNMIKMPACPVNLILGSKSRKPTKQSESLLAGVCTWMCDENK